MSARTISTASLSDSLSVTQARFELHRAMDFGGDAELSAWARKWGEAAVAAGEAASLTDPDKDFFWIERANDDLEAALEHAASIKAGLAAETPDVPTLRARAQSQLSRLQAISARIEEGE